MENDFCERDFRPGAVVMNEETVQSDKRHIIVEREGERLSSNDTYVSGEVLQVSLSDTTGEYLFECTYGEFQPGGCEGHRSCRKLSALVMPSEGEIVSIWAGWAMDHGTVEVSKEFILRPSQEQLRIQNIERKENELDSSHDSVVEKIVDAKAMLSQNLRGMTHSFATEYPIITAYIPIVTLVIVVYIFTTYKFKIAGKLE